MLSTHPPEFTGTTEIETSAQRKFGKTVKKAIQIICIKIFTLTAPTCPA